MIGKILKPYKNKKWEKKRISMLNKFNYECQEAKRYGLSVLAETVHHIYPVEEYPELMYEDWNLLPVSNKNHNKMHKRKSHELTTLGKMWQKKRRRQFEQWKRGELVL